jgi:hypothetical protein
MMTKEYADHFSLRCLEKKQKTMIKMNNLIHILTKQLFLINIKSLNNNFSAVEINLKMNMISLILLKKVFLIWNKMKL